MILLITILTLSVASLTTSCSVTPKTESATTIAYDGNDQNSGIVRELPAGGYEITSRKRDSYNAYIEDFGKTFKPPLKKDFGVEPLINGNFSMTFEAIVKFYEMIELRKNERIDSSDTIIKKIGL